MLGPADPIDVIYTNTRMRTPRIDQSSRTPQHRKKCTHTDSCYIRSHSGTGSTFTRGPCVFSNHAKTPD
ncbi:hypothetical protein TNCV_3904381 [Trichonephila clavipes]|nr:hypothetical protein TNCV_3904381 [Trichonephila clavipes]